MKKVLILSNHDAYTYNFRREIIQKLIDNNINVYIVLPYGEKVELLKQMGCICINLPLDRRGMNPLADIKLFLNYRSILKEIKPDVVLSYTIKPNIYGGLACRILRIPYIANVTGLGTAVEDHKLVSSFLIFLYKIAFKKISYIFFQNNENLQFFTEKKLEKVRGN